MHASSLNVHVATQQRAGKGQNQQGFAAIVKAADSLPRKRDLASCPLLQRSDCGATSPCTRGSEVLGPMVRPVEPLCRVAGHGLPRRHHTAQQKLGRSPHLCTAALATANLPRLHLVHRAQNQIAAAINPVLQPWVLINHEVLSTFLVGHTPEALDRVLAPRVDIHPPFALRVLDQPVRGIQPVLHSPR